MYRTCLLFMIGLFTLIMLLVVMAMTAYLAARLSYVQVGHVTCFTVSNSTERCVYAQAVTAAVFSGVSFLCVLVMMGMGLTSDNKDEPQTST
jgi:hypothetical protein